MFKNARWIWQKDGSSPDQYLSFKQKFIARGNPLTLRVCAETNYIAYLNGKRVAFGQFAGYKTEKYFDEILLKDCKKGENILEFTVFFLNGYFHILPSCQLFLIRTGSTM